ncbi:MAG: hypothetical protein WC120_05470 [Parcubacteria group bacterium]|jgi:hypothetical protein
MPSNKTSILKQINACKKRIAHERDVLTDLIGDLQAIEDSTGDALRALEEASDALSQYL